MKRQERLGLIEHIEEEKLMERKNLKRRKMRQRRKLLDKICLPKEIKQRKSRSRKKLSKRKIISKENKQENKLPETKSVPKKEKTITETSSVPTACVSPEPDKVKSKWSSRWNKLQLFVKKNDASKTETSLKERFSKIWKRSKKPESTEIHTEADEPSVTNTRAQTSRADKSSAQSSLTESEGFVELPPCLDPSDWRYDLDDLLYEEWFGTNDPRFVEWCRERNRDPTGGLSKHVPRLTPFERFTNNIKNRVSNFKRKREELRKVSELEKISMEATSYVNRRRKYWEPPETPEENEKWVRDHAGRLKQLKAHFQMLKEDIRHSDTGDRIKEKKVCFAAYTQDEMGISSYLKSESET